MVDNVIAFEYGFSVLQFTFEAHRYRTLTMMMNGRTIVLDAQEAHRLSQWLQEHQETITQLIEAAK